MVMGPPPRSAKSTAASARYASRWMEGSPMANGRLVVLNGDAFLTCTRPDGREVGPLRVGYGGTCDGWSYDELLPHGEGPIDLPKPTAASRPEPSAPAPLDAVASMAAHLRSQGRSPRAEVDVERRPGEPELAHAMRRRFTA